MSDLQVTLRTALKLVNALNKPPLKLSLSYQGLSTFQLYRISSPTMEKSAPPIPSASQCEFNGAHSCAHTQKTITLAPIHLFTKQMVPPLCPESLTQSSLRSFSVVLCSYVPYKGLPSINIIFMCALFFLCFFHFHHTLFRGLAGACVNPGSLF